MVDFDLRRPAFDEVFGLPLEPGVCEVLRQENEISSLVHQVATKNFGVVTAGRWDRNALASVLFNGAAAGMFKKLREDYDFVVVVRQSRAAGGRCPLRQPARRRGCLLRLPRRQQSPEIEAACEILAAFGVHTVEAAVTGPNDNLYGEDMQYESTISA